VRSSMGRRGIEEVEVVPRPKTLSPRWVVASFGPFLMGRGRSRLSRPRSSSPPTRLSTVFFRRSTYLRWLHSD